MPCVVRPDGVEIHWEERGEGATVVFANQFFAPPDLYEGLNQLLAAEHRLVTYDPRGIGHSTREGPYELETDVEDFVAVLEEVGGADVVVAVSDGCHRAVLAAARCPELVASVISPAGSPLARSDIAGRDGLAGSEGVVEALVQMARTDYKATLRTIIESINPQMTREEIRDRIDRTLDHAPQDQAIPRFENWIAADAREEALELGDRLVLLFSPGNPWFPEDVATVTRELLPKAEVIDVPDGAISEPEHTVRAVRDLIGSPKRAGA